MNTPSVSMRKPSASLKRSTARRTSSPLSSTPTSRTHGCPARDREGKRGASYSGRKGKGGWYETRGKIRNKGKSVRKRDKRIYKRADYGHWELDTVVSGLGKSKACFITLVERKSRFYKAIKSPNRHADVVARLIIDYLKQFPSELVKTITTDNGAEFADWQTIEKELNCEVYFCDTFCAWQKGSNENSNGLLREFFPKGYNLSRYTQAYIDKKVSLINNRPKKCNNWISPSKLMSEAISECCT